jgi:hypothetical protein
MPARNQHLLQRSSTVLFVALIFGLDWHFTVRMLSDPPPAAGLKPSNMRSNSMPLSCLLLFTDTLVLFHGVLTLQVANKRCISSTVHNYPNALPLVGQYDLGCALEPKKPWPHGVPAGPCQSVRCSRIAMSARVCILLVRRERGLSDRTYGWTAANIASMRVI